MKGNPKFNYGDKVKFTLGKDTFYGAIYIIDPYGTWDDPSDVSYDIMVDNYGERKEQCLFKHITESLVKKCKIYISLPIAIAEDSVAKRYKESVDYINKLDSLKNYDISGPINIHEFNDNGLATPREHDYAWYMGHDIENLLHCDAIFMSTGWEKSLGCRCELAAAKIYGLKVIYQFNS